MIKAQQELVPFNKFIKSFYISTSDYQKTSIVAKNQASYLSENNSCKKKVPRLKRRGT
jgi:hypothetical protein